MLGSIKIDQAGEAQGGLGAVLPARFLYRTLIRPNSKLRAKLVFYLELPK